MLSYDRVVFFKYELFCLGARIFLRDIEKTRVGR
jgi:hypothetical protein